MAYFKVALLAFVLWVVYVQVKNWRSWRALRKWGEQYGCEEPKAQENMLPGGLERYTILFTGMKGIDILEDFIRARYLSMKTGTYRMFNLFNSTLLQTMEPENIQAILATKFNDYELGEARTGNFGQVIGHGIFTAERESWQHFRHQLKPQFTRDQVSDLESAERHVNILFKALPQENSEGWIENTDLKPFLYRFTMDVSTEFLFGHSVNSQSQILHSLDSGNTQEIQADKDFSDAMNYGQEIIASRSRLRSYWWLINPPKFKKAVKTLQTFADRFVVAALALPVEKASIKEESEYGTKKRKFVLLNELVKETRDPIELRDQILHVLLAGRDTTSAMLSWALILLARHPEHYASLRAAVLEHFPSDGSVTPSFESLKACKQLTWVLHETLRLYPLVPINSRMATRDTVLPVGGGKDGKSPVVVKKGEQVAYAMYVLHRDERYWGKDSEEFSPGRWEGRKIGWDFVPFSGGPRVCLGQQYALNEASFTLMKFCQRFDKIEALDMTGPLKKGLTIVLSPGDGVKVRLHRASEA